MKAHQRLIREQLIGQDVLAGRWPPHSLDIATAEVRAISYAEARALIVQYEYLGTMPAVASHCFGLFFGDWLGGVVVYGPEYGANLRLWDQYGYDGRIVALLRGASNPWVPKNSASKLIRGSMKLLPERYKVVTATCDPQAGEIGTVYQASGFDYVGVMFPGTRLLVRDGERILSERTCRRRYGTADMGALEARGLTVERVPRRGRYFAFRGTRGERKALHAAIADKVRPYPKRSAVVVDFAGSRSGQKPGFVRVRRRQLKDGGISMTFELLHALRVGGKPRHEFMMTLGSQRSDRDLDGARFWARVNARMIANGFSAARRQRLVEEMIRKGARPVPQRPGRASSPTLTGTCPRPGEGHLAARSSGLAATLWGKAIYKVTSR